MSPLLAQARLAAALQRAEAEKGQAAGGLKQMHGNHSRWHVFHYSLFCFSNLNVLLAAMVDSVTPALST
eukprot:scaffold116627_cov16-Prasinocladus_malaysianus.AAC.1